jgi:predicted phosphodiesterase
VKYAIFSDIHGNLPALEAVLEEIGSRSDVDALYHLGDLVGYAPWPNEVVALLHGRGIPGVAGNYDSTTATRYAHCGCRYENPAQEELSHQSYAWTLAHVTEDARRRLGGLPFRIDLRPAGGHASGPRAVLVHGAPTLNTLYWTEDRSDDFCRKMAARAQLEPGDAILFGHTHLPWSREVDGVLFVNTGSVGRPKDGDPRAGYVLLEAPETGTRTEPEPSEGSARDAAGGAEGWRVEHVRVRYDVERAARAVEESDLPDAFAEQLRAGKT